MVRAALYARVSTNHQEASNQLAELRGYCSRQGWQVAAEFVDEDVRGKDPKPQLEAMLLAAHQKRFDIAVFWSLDRLTRKGALDALNILDQFAKFGVKYVSFTEPYISSVGPFSDVVVTLIATVANFEAGRMSERIRAGLARARADGKRVGRPPLTADPAQVVRDRAQGASWSELGEKYHISRSSARRLYQKGRVKSGEVQGGD